MKSLKIVLTAFFALFLFVCVFSQNNNGKVILAEETWDVTGEWIDCANEPVSGTYELLWTEFKNGQYQYRYSASLVGDWSGDEYSIMSMYHDNFNIHKGNGAFNFTFAWTTSLVNETTGMEVGVVHTNETFTRNANGEITVDFSNDFIECY